MDLKPNYNQLSKLEEYEINKALTADLVDHLYKGVPPGVIISFFSSAFIFSFLYSQQNKIFLIPWLITFYSALISLWCLNYWYVKDKDKERYSKRTWALGISSLLILCTMLWAACLFFMPEPLLPRYILLAILFMVAASFSMATVGNFILNVICVLIVMVPVAIIFFAQEDFYQKIGGIFVVMYTFFLLGMNRKSTEWLKNSLKLSRMLVSVSHSATHDFLTDLYNQRVLNKYIESFIETSPKEKFAIVCLSVNRLEKFNISLGYQAGDLIIQSLAKRLEHLLKQLNKKNDSVERILTLPRHDAFVILIRPAHLEDLYYETNQLFSILEVPFYLGQREATLTASVGVSVYPHDGNDPKTLLKNVYAAMFQAKQHAGNQVEYYKKEINDKAPSLLELENDLYHALARHEFLVYYQPIMDMTTKKISGMEALIRWKHPTKGIISPSVFLPLADETGLITPIGTWILEQACVQNMQWQQEFKNLDLKVSVNLASKQLYDENFIHILEEILKKTGINPRFLDLELTETEMLNDSLSPLIKQINQKGITLSIDDFGTGYSGFSYLKYFDIDKIKIDRSFIHNVTNNTDNATIVSAILAMAKELNIKSLAEGVETQEELNFLIEKNCDYVQGYYFSKPLPAEEFTQFLKTHL